MTNGHLSLKTFEENLDTSNLESIVVVRNPWSWQVSLYNYACKKKSHYQHGQSQYESFNTYIKWRCTQEVRLQSHFLESHQGGISVKHVLRFESLSDNWQDLAEKSGWKLPPLPHKNRSTVDDWRRYYTDETAALVGKTFDKDCRALDYRFDE